MKTDQIISLNPASTEPLRLTPSNANTAAPSTIFDQSLLIGSTNHDSPAQLRLAFSVKETAQMLGVSEKTVRRLIDRGLLHASRALRHLLIPKKEIEKFLDETAKQ